MKLRSLRIKQENSTHFKATWKLYEQAFPEDERRILQEQIKLFKKNNYIFQCYFKDEQFIGFLMYWKFTDICYIEHFAVKKELRAKGYGKMILTEFVAREKTPLFLEVEIPKKEIQHRRIAFYESMGWQLNRHDYYQANMRYDAPPYKLWTMSYPSPMTEEELRFFVENHHREIAVTTP